MDMGVDVSEPTDEAVEVLAKILYFRDATHAPCVAFIINWAEQPSLLRNAYMEEARDILRGSDFTITRSEPND